MPINEPAVNSSFGYYTGEFPPGYSNSLKYISVARKQVKCHYNAYNILKEINPDIPVGFVKQMLLFQPVEKTLINRYLTSYYNYFFNRSYLKVFLNGHIPVFGKALPNLRNAVDFWGLNFYTHKWVSTSFFRNRKFNFDLNIETTQTGWEWDAKGISEAIMSLWNMKKIPIYITENGIATDDDSKRKKFIYKHLDQVLQAIDSGIDIRGYFYWSLTDNFEWDMGYKPKFGLAGIEKNTFNRIPRESGYYLGKIAKTKIITAP